jgi:carboxymethylenebutenolidase
MEDLSRRVFVSSALATGFALATRPVAASTITTDSDGLTAGEVKIGQMPAYRAMPATGGKFPTVLVVQEIFGVHEYIRDVCRRLAKLGYFAVAPELYYRQGSVAGLTDFGEILKIVMKVPDEQVMKDLDATTAWANASGKVDGNKLGITGFCWGGRIVWLYSAHNPKVKAGVAWYGRISGAENANQTTYPLSIGKTLKTPVLGLYAGHDDGIPLTHIDLMKRELAAGNGKSQIQVYPNAQHGFHADYRKSYDPESAADGWKKMQDWFKTNGVG